MSKLVKTGKDITKEYHEVEWSKNIYGRDKDREREKQLEEQKYLLLPDGLDELEEMLKRELRDFLGMRCSAQASDKFVSSVFARFKKEQGMKSEARKKSKP